MGLFKPVWQGKNPDKACRAVRKITNQAKLLRIAREPATNLWAREAAIWKLTDQTVLADFARNGKNYRFRQAAVVNLTDQSVLSHIALNDEGQSVRDVAVKKLADQATLAPFTPAVFGNYKQISCLRMGTSPNGLSHI